MPGIKNILFWLFVGLALVGGGYAYFKLRELKKPPLEALNRLPANCAVYLYTHNLFELNNRLNTRSLVVDKFSDLPPLSDLLKTLDLFCEKTSEQPVLEETIKDNRVHFADYPEQHFWLLVFNLKELGQERDFQNAFAGAFKTKKLDSELYSFACGPNQTFFISYHNGGVGISNSEQGLQQLNQSETPKLHTESLFVQSSAEFENHSLLNLFVSHRAFSKYKHAIGFQALQKNGISSGQLEVLPSQLVFNGFVYPEDDRLLQTLLTHKPKSAPLEAMLPASCIDFKAYTFDNFTSFPNDGKGHNTNRAFWTLVKDTAPFDPEPGFYNNLTTSLCEFRMAGSSSPFLVCEISDTLQALEHLTYMSDSILTFTGKNIFRLNSRLPPPKLFYGLSEVPCAYAFLYDSYLYFGENASAVEWLSQLLNQGQTFENNPELMAYAREQFPDEFSYLQYTSPLALPQTVSSFYPAAKQLDKEKLSGLKHACLALVAQEKNYSMRWHTGIESGEEVSGEKLLWTMKLDTTCSMQPQEFINHISHEQELVVQDDANTLYLINSKGKILWKKKINEKIRSRVYRVDMFRNKKYQLLFSTDHYLHLIDRNANYVETYPKKTPAAITSPLQVFDYENNKEYRLFFACDNKRIYNYTIYALRNEKFSPVKTEAPVYHPIQYSKVGASDYLLAIDQEGKVYGFSRKGEMRFRLSNQTLVPCKEIMVDASNNLQNSKLIYVDEKAGSIHKISLSDKKEIIEFNYGESIGAYHFDYVDDNRNVDLLAAGAERLGAYNLNGNRLFDVEFPFEPDNLQFYSDENQSAVYGLNRSRAEVLLYNDKTKENKVLKASALPLFSNLFKNNKIYLIYPENDRLNCMAY